MRLLTFASGKLTSVLRSLGNFLEEAARVFPQSAVDNAVTLLRAHDVPVPTDPTDIVARASELLGPDVAAMCARVRVGPIADVCTEDTYALVADVADLYEALRKEAEAIRLKHAS